MSDGRLSLRAEVRMDLHLHFHLDLTGVEPLLTALLEKGERMAASLDALTTAIDSLTATLEAELPQIIAALQAATGDSAALQATIDAQVGRLQDLQARVAGIIPETP